MKREVLRMCIACRQRKSKQELIRVAFSDDFNTCCIDAPKADGRGVYICRNRACIDKCIKQKSINRTMKRNIPDSVYNDLNKVDVDGK